MAPEWNALRLLCMEEGLGEARLGQIGPGALPARPATTVRKVADAGRGGQEMGAACAGQAGRGGGDGVLVLAGERRPGWPVTGQWLAWPSGDRHGVTACCCERFCRHLFL